MATTTTPIVIGGTTINLPISGSAPNWAPAIIEFAQAVQDALNGLAGPFDVSPQIFVMTSNVNTNVSLPNLSFPTSTVRGAFIRYTVFRSTTGGGATTVSEAGNMYVTYNPTNTAGSLWEMSRDYVGDANVTFTITDVGQVQFSSASISGSGHTGQIAYTAAALLIL